MTNKKIGDGIEKLDALPEERRADLLRARPGVAAFLGLDTGPALDAVRSALYAMTPHSDYDFHLRPFDLGSVASGGNATESEALLTLLLSHQQWPVCLERNHTDLIPERVFLKQIRARASRLRPLFLNLTSRLDFPAEKNFAALAAAGDCDVIHLGVQSHDCLRDSLDEALAHGMKVVPLPKIQSRGLYESLRENTELRFSRPVWVRLDVNALAFAQGGGTGSWADGLAVRDLIHALEWLIRQTQFQGLSLGALESLHPSGLSARSLAQILSAIIFAHAHRQMVSYAHGERSET